MRGRGGVSGDDNQTGGASASQEGGGHDHQHRGEKGQDAAGDRPPASRLHASVTNVMNQNT